MVEERGQGAPTRLAVARLAAATAIFIYGALAASGLLAQATPRAPAVLLDVSGAIGPATTGYIERGLSEARSRDAAIVVLTIDTPGGLESATRDIVRAILASPVPVATFVAPGGARAASAGTYILYASSLAAMAPGTNLGAATPISLGGGTQPLGGEEEEGDAASPADAAGAKAASDAAAFLRSLAEFHGRDTDFAERAVREAASLSAAAALEAGVVEFVAEDVTALLRAADGTTVRTGAGPVSLRTADAPMIALEPTLRDRLLAAISNPNLAYLFLLIGIYGIIFELASPGAFVPGVVGAIALLVGVYSLNLVGVDYAGAGLLLLGVALMAAEAFVPSFGILGIGGAVAFAAGSLFLFEEAPGFRLSPGVVIAATAASGLLLAVVLAAFVRSRRARTVSGDAAITGAVGRVLAWSGSEGEVEVHGERWHARSAAPLRPGDAAEITGRDGLVLAVRPTAAPGTAPRSVR